jgi:hypothetical protein
MEAIPAAANWFTIAISMFVGAGFVFSSESRGVLYRFSSEVSALMGWLVLVGSGNHCYYYIPCYLLHGVCV